MLADYLLAQFGGVTARHLFHWRALAKMEVKSVTVFPLAVNIESQPCTTSCSHRECTELFSFYSINGGMGVDAFWIAKPHADHQRCIRHAEYSRGYCSGWKDVPGVLDSEEQE